MFPRVVLAAPHAGGRGEQTALHVVANRPAGDPPTLGQLRDPEVLVFLTHLANVTPNVPLASVML